LEGL
jgi:hypothetical protein